MKISMTFVVDVDPAAWTLEFPSVERHKVAADVRQYYLTHLQESYPGQQLGLTARLVDEPGPSIYQTKTGRVLTNEEIQALADEAEHGYDIKDIRPKK